MCYRLDTTGLLSVHTPIATAKIAEIMPRRRCRRCILIGRTAGALARRELVKVRLPAGAAVRREMAEALAGASSAAVVGVVGRTILLYRPNPNLDEATR